MTATTTPPGHDAVRRSTTQTRTREALEAWAGFKAEVRRKYEKHTYSKFGAEYAEAGEGITTLEEAMGFLKRLSEITLLAVTALEWVHWPTTDERSLKTDETGPELVARLLASGHEEQAWERLAVAINRCHFQRNVELAGQVVDVVEYRRLTAMAVLDVMKAHYGTR
jgi:hypothetical protein